MGTPKAHFDKSRSVPLILRSLAMILGAYGVTSGAIAVLSTSLVTAGMAPSEAAMLCVMLAVPVYLGVIVWGFAASRPTVLFVRWAVIAGAGFAAAALIG